MVPSEHMMTRAAEIFAAFEKYDFIHRGHLVAWAMHRPEQNRDGYVHAFRTLFGAGRKTLRWKPLRNQLGMTATPELGRAIGTIVPHEKIERARVSLAGDTLPDFPVTTFMDCPVSARGNAARVVSQVQQLRNEIGTSVFYGQRLAPGGLLRIARTTRKDLGNQLGWWKSGHSWVIRNPKVQSDLLWAVPVSSSQTAQELKNTFVNAFSQFRYSFKPGFLYGKEWFFDHGEVQVISSILRDFSDTSLLNVKEAGRAGEFYQ